MDDNKKGFMQDKELYNHNGESSELHFSNGMGHIPNLKSTLKKNKEKGRDEMVMHMDKEIGFKEKKEVNNDSATDEDPDE